MPSPSSNCTIPHPPLPPSFYLCEEPLQRLTYLYNILVSSIRLRGGSLASAMFNYVGSPTDPHPQTNHGDAVYRTLALSLLKDINTHILKQSWQWAVNGRLLDMHAEFFVEIAVPSESGRFIGG